MARLVSAAGEQGLTTSGHTTCVLVCVGIRLFRSKPTQDLPPYPVDHHAHGLSKVTLTQTTIEIPDTKLKHTYFKTPTEHAEEWD